MVLAAFVLVLVAAVMLVIGTFLDASVVYIWVSIGACLATFAVVAASYLARRRRAAADAARPQPLAAGDSRGATGSTASTTGGGDGPATTGGPETETVEEPTVRVVPRDTESTTVAEQPAATEAAPARRVVRRVQPQAGTRKVVRRAQSAGGTPTVVRRTADGQTRVVRRAGAAGGAGQRTVRRVVRTAPAEGAAAASSEGDTTAGAALSEIKGVGPAKQEALLERFGSLELVASASVEELTEVKGVGPRVAAQIKAVLQDR